MQCPKCGSYSVIFEKGNKMCRIPQCNYEDQHPISFENDVRHYQGQKNGEDRFSNLYNTALDNGGIGMDKQANYDKQYKKGLKYIKDLCHLRKLVLKIEQIAKSRFTTILKLKIKGKLSREQESKSKKNQEVQQVDKTPKKQKQKFFSIKELACYSVYSACFQNQNYTQEYYLAKWLKLNKKDWDILLKEINSNLKYNIQYIPNQKPWHFVARVCLKRNINLAQQRAMMQMCDKIYQAGIQDGCPRKTVAACVFWKVCEYSTLYRKQIRLSQICKKHQQLQKPSQMLKYFDCNPQTIRKFFSQKMQKQFFGRFLPEWDGRINIQPLKRPKNNEQLNS